MHASEHYNVFFSNSRPFNVVITLHLHSIVLKIY